MHVQKHHGQWGEEMAARLLVTNGFEIVERNWRYKRAEIDIIARDKEVLVFVEVKTRANTYYGRPEEMIGSRKKRLIIDAAMAYMRSIGYEWEIRFDIIAVTGSPGSIAEVKHFADAFFPGLDSC